MAKKKGKGKARPVRVKAGTSKAAAKHRKALFVDAYIANGGNGTQAALSAGYSPGRAADKAAQRMSQDVAVQKTIAARRAEVEKKSGLSVERTLREVARLSYSDIRKLYNEDGTLKLPHEWDDDAAAAVAGVEVNELFDGAGEVRDMIGYTKKVKHWDKNSALEKAMKFHGLYEKDNEQAATAVARIFKIPGKQRGGA